MSASSTIDLSELPYPIHPLSRVKIRHMADGTYAVATHDFIKAGVFKLSGRWFGRSEGEAMLIAQYLETRGYRLLDDGRPT